MTPHVLLPYQQAVIGDRSPVRWIEKSRRVGISWALGSDSVLDGASIDGNDTWYVGYNHDMSQEFIRDCAFWARAFNVLASEVEQSFFDDKDGDTQILQFTIRFSTGWRITALSSRPTNLRAKKGHIIIDEAAFHPDLPGLIKSAMAVRMWGGKGRVTVVSTHNGTENHFNKIVEAIRAKKRPYTLHRITLDDALEQGLYERICFVNGDTPTAEGKTAWRAQLYAEYGDDAEEELDCVPARSGGTYINRDLIERVMRPGPVLRLSLPDGFLAWVEPAQKGHIEQWCKENLAAPLAALPKDKMHFFGEDFGRTADRTVIVPGYIAQDLKRVFPFAVELSNVPYERQRDVLFYIVDRLPKFQKGALDATGNGGYLAEQCALKYGAGRIEKIMLTEKWYAENLPPFKAAFEEQKLTIVRDADHMVDISHLKVINGLPKLPSAKTKTASGEGPPRHGDAAIAYALGWYASSQPTIEHEGYQGASRATSGFKARGGVL